MRVIAEYNNLPQNKRNFKNPARSGNAVYHRSYFLVRLPVHEKAVAWAEGLDKGSGGTTQKTSVKTSVKILEILRRNPELTLADVAVEIGLTRRAVEMASSKLVKEGRLKYTGPQKGGHWEVTKSATP